MARPTARPAALDRHVKLRRLAYRAASLPWLHVRSLVQGGRLREAFGDVECYCQFIGYPRSGHTLVYALLNAHPEVVLSNEMGVLEWMRFGFTRDQLYSMILRSDRRFAKQGFSFQGYEYRVPGQWQGRFQRLRVIGDKDGGRDTTRLRHSPALLERLRQVAGVPIRFVHVVRNPFDMMATFVNRRVQRGEPTRLEAAFSLAREAVATVQAVIARVPEDTLLTVRVEDLIRDPAATLTRLCAHVGVTAEADYLRDCARIVFPSSRQTRASVEWTPDLIRRVESELIGRCEFLAGYTFER